MTTQRPVAQIPPKPAYTRYACIAGDPQARQARCQESAVANLRCEGHQDPASPRAARPTKVQIYLNMGVQHITPELRAMNTHFRNLSFTRQPEGRIDVIAQAESCGRNPFRFRKMAPDTGSLVFSVPPPLGHEEDTSWRGAQNVSAPLLLTELSELNSNLAMVWLELWEKQGVKPGQYVLKITFAHTGQHADIPSKSAIIGMTWAEAFVWCNIPRDDGVVLHTVQLKGPQDINPRGILHFEEGDWGIEPVNL